MSESSQRPSSDQFDGHRVRDFEVEEIQKRRKVAFNSDTPPKDETQESLVGVALSGGGIRSGAFHLGVIQAFLERNTLRFVDFLSTVSGGGYAGGYLTSRASSQGREVDGEEGSRPPQGLSRNDPFPYPPADDDLPIQSGQHGRQAPVKVPRWQPCWITLTKPVIVRICS